MFNKKYLAIATLAALTPGMASALTITSTALTGTNEGLTGVDDVTAGATVITTGVPYVANDIVSITYGSALDEGFSPATTAIACVDSTGGDLDPGDALFRGIDTMSIQYSSTSADRKTVDYVVTAFGGEVADGNGSGDVLANHLASDGIGMACTIAGAAFNGDDMIAAKVAATGLALPVSASSKSTTTGNVKEATAAAAAANAFTVEILPQFGLDDAAAQMTASINVSASPLPRGKFVPGGIIAASGVVLTSSFDITAEDVAGANNAASVAAGSSATLTGDYSWMLKADGTFKTGYSVVVTPAPAAADAVACTATACTWGLTKAQIDAGQDFAVVLTTDGATTIPTANWTQTLVVAYTNVDGQAQTAKSMSDSAGSWTINGATIQVYGIPNSTSSELMLHIGNRGTQTGAISVALICDSVTTSASFSGGSLVSLGSTSLSKAVTDAAAADCNAGSRYDAVITINAPLTDVTAVAGYKILQAEGNDRLTLETSQTLPSVSRL